MPNGTTHAKATVALALAGGFLSYQLGHPHLHALALSGGALAGLVLTPDLDVDRGCISIEIVRQSAGRPAGWIWKNYWRPYGKLIRHRSKLSHLPVLGTTVRLIYLGLLPLLIIWFASGALPRPVFPEWAAWSIGGLILADALHYLMDRLS